MSRQLTIAAIIPVYNQRATVVDAIQSVWNQTRPVDEIIVVDDGSTDGSGDLVAERYGDRVRLLRQENRGAAGAFNTGVRASTSDLISLLGADDRWLPNRIERQAALMEDQPSCMLSFTAAMLADEIHGVTMVEGAHIDKDTYLRKAFFQEEALPAGNGVMVRREVFEEVGYFDERLRKCQDTDMWLRIMIRHGFEHIPEPLVWVRRGAHRTEPDISKWFPYHDLYFRKHRYTFGRGVRGQAIWRAGYGAVLRSNGIWCLRHDRPGQATRLLLRALCLWPFFNPTWVFKAILEYLLGPDRYRSVVALLRKIGGKRTTGTSHA
jgi:glycosyltransferase involved in cell wall biosynthesis